MSLRHLLLEKKVGDRLKNKVRYLLFGSNNTMSLNKNKIFRIASFILTLLGTALILIGALKFKEYSIAFYIGGAGFMPLLGR